MGRQILRNRILTTATLLCFLNAATEVAHADVVFLKSGAQLQCTVQDREQVAASPGSYSRVSILVQRDGQDEIYQVDAVSIDYIVLEDGEQKRVIAISPVAPVTDSANSETGIFFTIVGLGCAVLGVANKFGGPKATVTESSINVDDESYNGTNYALMIGGGLMFVLGVGLMSSSGPAPTVAGLHVSPSGLGLCYRVTY